MSYQQQYQRWLRADALSQEERAQLLAMADDPAQIEDRFFSMLEFGTAGLRGIMGVGLRRMNLHVIRHATQAFAQVILAEGPAAAGQGRGHLLRLPPALPGVRPGRRRRHGGQRHPRAPV